MAPGPPKTKVGPIFSCLMARPRYKAHPWKPAGSCAHRTVLRQQPQHSHPSPQPYTPKDPPVVRVMEGPLFSEVASYYQHAQTVMRLYNVPGEILRLCHVSLAHELGDAARGAQPLTTYTQGWRACPWMCPAWWISVTTSTKSWPCVSALTLRAMTPSSRTSMASKYAPGWGRTAAVHRGTVPWHRALWEPPLATDLCSLADPAPQVPSEAATAGQLLPYACHGVHPGHAEPPDTAHSPGPGRLQPPQR